jgi:uncharacterized protein YjaZ
MLTYTEFTETQTGLFAKNKESEVNIMKLATVIIAAALAIPATASFAQNQPLTRAEVKAQLVQAEQAGYNPNADNITYPAQIQAADAKIAAQNGQNSYGGVADTSSASGRGVSGHTGNNVAPTYFGH